MLLEFNSEIKMTSEIEDTLNGIAEPIKVKLIELKNQLDKVEAVVQKADSLSITELHENVKYLIHF